MAKKLFELLVVEGQLKTQAQSTRADLRNTFEKKRHLFEEKRTTFTPVEEGAQAVTEEQSDIQTTIPSELQWIAALWSKAMDTSYQVAEGNTRARADVVLDSGAVLLSNVPATALLELEKRMGEVHELLLAVPTLDPAKGFKEDVERGKHIYRAREVHKTRTRKVQKPIVLFPATVEHPAQTQLISIDEPAGQLTAQEWSGLVTPAQKSAMLERAEDVRRACKAALHRANAVEMGEDLPTCGRKLFDYILPTD
jgi:hypothetical protein